MTSFCRYCNKEYKHPGGWLQRHEDTCPKKSETPPPRRSLRNIVQDMKRHHKMMGQCLNEFNHELNQIAR